MNSDLNALRGFGWLRQVLTWLLRYIVCGKEVFTDAIITKTFVQNSSDTGWYSNTGAHNAGNKNYSVGGGGFTRLRNDFVFSLSGITGTVTAAS